MDTINAALTEMLKYVDGMVQGLDGFNPNASDAIIVQVMELMRWLLGDYAYVIVMGSFQLGVVFLGYRIFWGIYHQSNPFH